MGLITRMIEKENQRIIDVFGNKAGKELISFDAIFDNETDERVALGELQSAYYTGSHKFYGLKNGLPTLFSINYDTMKYVRIAKANAPGFVLGITGSSKYKMYAYVDSKTNLEGLVSRTGKSLVSARFDHVGNHIVDGIVDGTVRKDDRVGVINSNFKFVDLNMFDEHKIISKNLIWVKKDYRCGVIDENKNVIVPVKFNLGDLIIGKCELGNFILIRENNRWSALDEAGNSLMDQTFKSSEEASNYAKLSLLLAYKF